MALTIPRIIMQTWKTTSIPSQWAESPRSIARHFPDWKYVLMTDDDNRQFVVDHFPAFLALYDGLAHPIQRADIIRYMWLYIHGGLYLDLDYLVQANFEHLFTGGEVFLAYGAGVKSRITNSIMASAPGNKFWLEVLANISNRNQSFWQWTGKHLYVMNTTGPMMLDDVRSLTTTPITILPADKINPCSICDRVCSPTEAYLKPLTGLSWSGWDTKIYNGAYCYGLPVLGLVALVVVLILLMLMAVKY